MKLTRHGAERVGQRHGKRGDKARELVNRAFLNGKPRESLTGALRKWVDDKFFEHDGEYLLIVHGGFLYVFSEIRRLITTYKIPEKILSNKKNKGLKKLIKKDLLNEALLL